MSNGLLISVTVAISASIGAGIGFVLACALLGNELEYWRTRAAQLERRLASKRPRAGEENLFLTNRRGGRIAPTGRPQETATPG